MKKNRDYLFQEYLALQDLAPRYDTMTSQQQQAYDERMRAYVLDMHPENIADLAENILATRLAMANALDDGDGQTAV
jgi:hypothetical protein